MKEQLQILKAVYSPELPKNHWAKYSLIVICKENTTFTLRYIGEQFNFFTGGESKNNALYMYESSKKFKKYHQEFVDKLLESGFRFV